MRGRFTFHVLGVGFIGLALVMLVLALYAALLDEPAGGLLATFLASGLAGSALLRVGSHRYEPTHREALVSVLALWATVPLFGAVPFALSGYFSPLDAYFEAMSGFTTTGATVLQNFDTFPESLFMWRSLTQWIGGIGIIVIFIAVFPQLALAGRQLFFAEVPGPTEERLTPRLRNTAKAVLLVYAGLTLLCALAYLASGMSASYALQHAFTTLASGGFSPEGLSFAGFSAAQQWIASLFMVFAGANFALQYQLAVNRSSALFKDAEFRAYLALVALATAAFAAILVAYYGFEDALRHGLFQALTIITTTGYASADFALWPDSAQTLILLLMFVGGSAGSAAGGVKVVRWLIVVSSVRREVRRALHPRALLPVRVGKRIVDDAVLRAVAAFIGLYLLLFGATTATLTMFGADLVTAVSASIACLGNIGPGLASVGPMANFAELHPVSRAVLIFGMYAGRLEVVAVFALLERDLWRLPRWNGFRR